MPKYSINLLEIKVSTHSQETTALEEDYLLKLEVEAANEKYEITLLS